MFLKKSKKSNNSSQMFPFSLNYRRVLESNGLATKRALFLKFRNIIRLQQILYAVKVKNMEFAALQLHYFTGFAEMIQANGALRRLDKDDVSKGKLPNSPEHRLVPPIHQGHISQVLPVVEDAHGEHVDQHEGYQDEDEHCDEGAEEEDDNEHPVDQEGLWLARTRLVPVLILDLPQSGE